MKQSKIDSFMEAVTNILIGTAIYTFVNYTLLAWMLGIPISVGKSLSISALFTVVSIARSYTIRRLFNGKSVWQALSPWLPRFHYGKAWDGLRERRRGWTASVYLKGSADMPQSSWALRLERRWP